MTRRWLALCVCLAACGGGEETTEPTRDPAPTSGGEPTAQLAGDPLTLAELQLIDEDEQPLLLHADGRLELEGRELGTVRADGSFVVPSGERVLWIDDEGYIESASGRSPLRLTEQGELVTPDTTVTIGASGELEGALPGAPRIRVIGASDPGTRRTALFVLALMTAGGSAEPPPPPEESPPPQ